MHALKKDHVIRERFLLDLGRKARIGLIAVTDISILTSKCMEVICSYGKGVFDVQCILVICSDTPGFSKQEFFLGNDLIHLIDISAYYLFSASAAGTEIDLIR